MDIEVEGVWLSDVPLDGDEGAVGDTLLAVMLDDADLVDCEVIEEGKTHREWIVPAAVLNGRQVRIVPPDEEEAVSRRWGV